MLVVLLYLIAIAQLCAFVMFGLDKRFARHGKRRIPESWLIGSAFCFGLFGAWTAMSVFHHKTRKTSFLWKMRAVTLLNPLWLVAVAWWRGAL